MEIPQENNEVLEGQRKIMYAKNKNGDFCTYKYGSKAEEFATKTAVYEYRLLENECLERIKNGISSPIEFYMYKNRMDISTLSRFMNMFSFRIKRHLKMKYFKKLNDDILQKYANIFEINLKDLKEFNG